VVFSAGLALPLLATCLILWAAGVFPQFVFWTISYARQYASFVPAAYGPGVLQATLDVVIGPNLAFWLLPWAGALVMFWDERLAYKVLSPKSKVQSPEPEVGGSQAVVQGSRFEVHPSSVAALRRVEGSRFSAIFHPPPSILHARFFLTALFLCSVASTSVGFHFREHYFITLLPILSLLTGVAVSRAFYLLKQDQTIELFLAIPILGAFAIGLGAAVIGNGFIWFASPDKAGLAIYGTTLFQEAEKLGGRLRESVEASERGSVERRNVERQSVGASERAEPQHAPTLRRSDASDASDAPRPLAVIGSEPEIYFYARRRSATGYLYTYPMMEPQPFAAKMQEEMMAEIERNKPECVVYVDDDISWLRRPNSDLRINDLWKNYWKTNLELINTIPIHQPAAEAAGINDPKYLLLLKRKEPLIDANKR
jgi:hypothetical protein